MHTQRNGLENIENPDRSLGDIVETARIYDAASVHRDFFELPCRHNVRQNRHENDDPEKDHDSVGKPERLLHVRFRVTVSQSNSSFIFMNYEWPS